MQSQYGKEEQISDIDKKSVKNQEPNINQNLLGEKDSKSNKDAIIKENNPNLEETSNTIILTQNKLLNIENEKNDEIKIEDILENDDYFNDLRNNSNSPFKKLLTTDNIKKLINFCLLPLPQESDIPQKQLRYPYYSSLILCSPLVLLFSASIENIIKFTNEKNKNSQNEISKEHTSKKNSNSNKKSSQNNSNGNGLIYDDMNNLNEKESLKNSSDEFFQFKEYNEKDEKYADITETEIKKETISKKPMSDYNKEEKEIVGEIFKEIFKMLDSIKKEDQTYMGYFQKIINYILFNESEHLFNYLFENKEKKGDIIKLYKHLDKAAINNIMENMLNILADNEEKLSLNNQIQYYIIIKDIIQELKNDYDNYEKFEGICELIINTLINNSEKQLIKLVLNKEEKDNIIIQLQNIFIDLVNKNIQKENNKNYDKQIIAIIKLIYQLNNIFISSFYEYSISKKNNNYLSYSIDNYKKINAFEYQYNSQKKISILKIFIAYKSSHFYYLSQLLTIYKEIKEKIKQKYNENNNNNNNNNNSFGLRNIYEWKLILSILKIYVYSYYTLESKIDIKKNIKKLADEKLFKILIKYYFKYPKNNLYQNIFVEVIKLICNEKCPKCLIAPFLKQKSNKRNKFIYKIIKNLKENRDDKFKFLRGSNIEILRLFFTSLNKTISNYIEKYEKDTKIKNLFLDSVDTKLERKILDDLEYSDSEIFNSDNENNDTFDGNDVNLPRKFDSFNKTVGKFLEKCKEKKQNLDNKKTKIKCIITDTEIGDIVNSIKDFRETIESEKEGNTFEIQWSENIELEENLAENSEEDISSDSSDN